MNNYHLIAYKNVTNYGGSNIFVDVSIKFGGEELIFKFLVDSGHSLLASLP